MPQFTDPFRSNARATGSSGSRSKAYDRAKRKPWKPANAVVQPRRVVSKAEREDRQASARHDSKVDVVDGQHTESNNSDGQQSSIDGMDGQQDQKAAEEAEERFQYSWTALVQKALGDPRLLDINRQLERNLAAEACVSKTNRLRNDLRPHSVRSLLVLVMLLLIVFGTLYTMVEYLLLATRASAACSVSTVYVPVPYTVSPGTTNGSSAILVSPVSGSISSTTPTVTLTSTSTQTLTSFITIEPSTTPAPTSTSTQTFTSLVTVEPVTTQAPTSAQSSGTAYVYTVNSAGSTDWINGVSPSSGASLVTATTSIIVTTVTPAASPVDSTVTQVETITPPAYTSTLYSYVSPDITTTSTSTHFVTMSLAYASPAASGSSSRSSFSGVGSGGWNASAPVDPARGPTGLSTVDPILTTMTQVYYWGDGDATTSTSTSLITTTIALTYTTTITPSLPTQSSGPFVTTITQLPVTITPGYGTTPDYSTSISAPGVISTCTTSSGSTVAPVTASTISSVALSSSTSSLASTSSNLPMLTPGSSGVYPIVNSFPVPTGTVYRSLSGSASISSATASSHAPVSSSESQGSSSSTVPAPQTTSMTSAASPAVSALTVSTSSTVFSHSGVSITWTISGTNYTSSYVPLGTSNMNMSSTSTFGTASSAAITPVSTTSSSISIGPVQTNATLTASGSSTAPSLSGPSSSTLMVSTSRLSGSSILGLSSSSTSVSTVAPVSSHLTASVGTTSASSSTHNMTISPASLSSRTMTTSFRSTSSAATLSYMTPSSQSTLPTPASLTSSPASTPSAAPSSMESTASSATTSVKVQPSSISSSTLSASVSTMATTTSVSRTLSVSSPSSTSLTSRPQSQSLSSLSAYSYSTPSISTSSFSNPFPASSATATPSAGCGEQGNFLINFDDLPNFMPTNPNQTDITQAPPIQSPYHHLTFSNGYVYAPSPSEPYPPVSSPHLAVFLANATGMKAGAPYGSLVKPGEFGDGPRDSMSAYWFDAYSAWLGCDDEGPEPCTMVMKAYTWSPYAKAEILSYSQNVTMPPCPGFKNCHLRQVSFPASFRSLSGLQIQAFVGKEERMFFMDDLALHWSNSSCAAGLQRQMSQ